MARTKAKARRGPAGREFRENMKTAEGRKLNKENKKRKHETLKASKSAKRAKTSADDERSVLQPANEDGYGDNKDVEDDAMNVEEEDESAQLEPEAQSTMNNPNNTVSSNLTSTSLDIELAKFHEVTTMSILSSSQIQQKVTRTLSLLSVYPVPTKPAIVMLHAKSKAATKMISIAEIVKREIAGKDGVGGKWYQYNKVGQIMEEQKQVSTKDNSNGMAKAKDTENMDGTTGDPEDEDEAESDEEAFETMKTPFERALEGKPKVRAVPVMTIYLSRVRIEGLRKEYGEQTNGLELPQR